MEITVIPALSDNYIALAVIGDEAVLVDPGDGEAALAAVRESGRCLSAVLVTHRHHDHIGGLPLLRRHYPQAMIYAPANCGIDDAVICKEGDILNILGESFSIIATPGHTMEHIVYAGDKVLFAGDTLFACGCGRVFEGSLRQMAESLQKIAALPDNTMVYCGHEYTAANIRFALAVEPENEILQKRAIDTKTMRQENRATIPFTLGMEKETNPFMRLEHPAVIAAAGRHMGKSVSGDEEVFAVLRRWKDSF